MTIAKDIMETAVITVAPQTSIKELAEVLTKNKISGVPVVESNYKLVGIVTEGDLLHKEVTPSVPMSYAPVFGGLASLKDFEKYKDDVKKLSAMTAEEIMTTKLFTVSEDADIRLISSIMMNNNINRVPVVAGDKLVGIVSRSDVIKTLAE
ncbi:MAG: CBS domain-containing protein [Andreesenia angusta]|nr:CBS domain-containing protein [Andreesenia angusta]